MLGKSCSCILVSLSALPDVLDLDAASSSHLTFRPDNPRSARRFSLWSRRYRKKRTMPIREAPTTLPMTIPAMAPPERPPLLLPLDDSPLWLFSAGAEDGDGVDDSSGSSSVTLKQGT